MTDYTKLFTPSPALNQGQITARVNRARASNGLYTFPLRTNPANATARILVPKGYNAWLSPLPVQQQRYNLLTLRDKMHANHGPHRYQEIAVGFAKYLVRNLANPAVWSPQRLQSLLIGSYNRNALFELPNDQIALNPFARARRTFIHELSRPGPNGSLPRAIVNEVSTRLLTVARNDWACRGYDAVLTNQRQQEPEIRNFSDWASQNGHDLTTANANNLWQQYSNNLQLSARTTTRMQGYVAWLTANGANVPQHL